MQYKYYPKTKEELIEIIKKEIFEIQGSFNNPNWKANLNCIDTSNIIDMSYLFSKDIYDGFKLSKFNGDISEWDVSSVIDMSFLFYGSQFNGNLRKWNVNNVKNMEGMFLESTFNGNISKWNTSNVTNMSFLFYESKFNGDISKWNVSNVENMAYMFYKSKFNGDISKWDVSNVRDMKSMFHNSKFNGDISNWNVENVENMESMFEESEFNGDIENWNISDKIRKDTKLNNISANFESDRIPDKVVSRKTADRILKKYPEIGMVRKDVQRFMSKEKIKELTDIYSHLEIDNKTMVKFMDIFALKIPYEEKIIMCYKEAKNNEERMKAIGFTVLVPYIKEREKQRELNKDNSKDINTHKKP